MKPHKLIFFVAAYMRAYLSRAQRMPDGSRPMRYKESGNSSAMRYSAVNTTRVNPT